MTQVKTDCQGDEQKMECIRTYRAKHSFQRWRENIMAKRKKCLSPKYQPWVDARKRFHLSDMHIQMARELGLNPKKFGSLANHKQEPWKEPLPEFIESIYQKRFKKDRPDVVRSVEQVVKDKKRKQAERKALKQEQPDRQPEPPCDFKKAARPTDELPF